MQNITIYAHATRAGNRVHYGCLLVTNHRTWIEGKSVLGTSANRTILQAAIDIVQKLSKKHQIKFFSTSQYLIQGMTEYIQGWKQRGWLDGPASPLKNNDLWKQLDQLTEKHHISWLYPRNSDEQRQMEKATDQAYAPSQKAMQQQWAKTLEEEWSGPFWQRHIPRSTRRCETCDCPISIAAREPRSVRFCSQECESGVAE